MNEIKVEHNPSPAKLEVLGVYDWPVWEKETSKFAWSYDTKETCYVLEGEVTVTPGDGEPVRLKAGGQMSKNGWTVDHEPMTDLCA